MTAWAIACAVAAAVFAAIGAQLQHSGVGNVSTGGKLRIRNLAGLARDRTWRLGVLAHVGAVGLQALAIAMAPVVVVSPIVVLALPLVAVLSARRTRRRLGPLALTGIAATTGGLALFVFLASGTAVGTDVTGQQVFVAVQVIAPVALVLVLVASRNSGRVRCLALAVAAGALHGLVAVLFRRIAHMADAAGFVPLPILSIVTLLIAFLAAAWLVQASYASGPPDLVVATVTALNPVVAIAIGVSVLGETAGIGAGTAAALLTSGGVAALGILALARSHAVAFDHSPAPATRT